MKSLKFIGLFLCTTLFFACDNELDLIEEWKDIPIVYGLISSTDTAQYIRVEKAYLDGATSALDLAQIADSLYYDNPSVAIVHDGLQYQLERVDGNLEGYVRDQGVFAQAPNYLYKIKSSNIPLVEGDTYTFNLIRNDFTPLVSGETTLVGEPLLRIPSQTSSFGFSNLQKTRILWDGGLGAKVFDLTLRCNYRENLVDKYVDWKVTKADTNFDVEVLGLEFYSFLAGALVEDPSVSRVFMNIDLIINSGAQEAFEYIQVGQANLGITSSQDIPNYSNLSEGRGLFSSKHLFTRFSIPVTVATRDSIRMGQYTRHLGFQ